MRINTNDTKRSVFLILILLVFILFDDTIAQINEVTEDYLSLQNGFINPPDESHVKTYWWWLNGAADKGRIREELISFREVGISAVDIFDIGTPDHSDTRSIVDSGPAFMSDEYLENIGYAVEVADELGMKIGLNLASSWNAGGEWIPPKHASKSLYFSKVNVNGADNNQEIDIPFPTLRKEDDRGRNIIIEYDDNGRPAYYDEVAVIAKPSHKEAVYPDTSQILNLTKYLDSENNTLNWDAPEGNWDVYRYIVANSGRQVVLPSENSWGPIIDHYDADAMEFHVNYFIDRLSTVIDNIEESALSYLYLASYEARGFSWTTLLPDSFKNQHGYDVYKFLPSLHIQDSFVQSGYPGDDVAQGFLYDFNQTISEMMINNHYRKGRKVANRVGLKLISESGGPGLPLHNAPVEALAALGALDIPRGEFWYKHARWTTEDVRFAHGDSLDLLQMVKGPAAAGNIYKKPQVEMEAFTSWRQWQTGPYDIKSIGDRAFAEGMNRVVVHGASHNPKGTGYPGIVYHAGTHYNDKRVWWPKIKPFNEYLSRISFMAQEGSFYSDVLYYHGDQAPNIVRAKNQDFSVGAGYDYEVINTDILLRDLTVEDGKLVLPGVGRYHVMVLDPSDTINPLVLDKIIELANQGGIILGKKPHEKPGLSFDEWSTEEIQTKITNHWTTVGSQNHSKENLSSGKIIDGISALEALQLLDIKPDIAYFGQKLNGPLDYIHYKTENLSYYFVRNTTDNWLTKSVKFREADKVPELWNPVTSQQHSFSVYKMLDDQISIPLTFKPNDAYFVVFREGEEDSVWEEIVNNQGVSPAYGITNKGYVFRDAGEVRLQKAGQTNEFSTGNQSFSIDGEWQLEFAENWGAPTSTVLPELISWTDSENEGIKYFSGIATYHKSFDLSFNPDTLSAEYRIYLNLGDLEKVGDVWLNGDPLGITWAKPHEYDITEYIQSGDNALIVEIANVWANRVIGDARTGEDFTTTNITNVRGTPWEDVSLVPSGLLGPVSVELRKVLQAER